MISFGLFGCGSVGENSGTLSATAPANNNGVVTAVATFTPSNRAVLPNTPINFRWYTVGVTSKAKSAETSTKSYSDASGIATFQVTLPVVRDESLIFYVMASTGDLINVEGWQSVQVDP